MAHRLMTKITFLDEDGINSVVVPYNHLNIHFLLEQFRWEGREIEIVEAMTYEEETV